MNILVVCHYALYQDLGSSFVHAPAREYAAQGHRVRVIVPIPWGKPDRRGRKIGPPVEKTTVDNVEIHDVRFLSASGRGRKKFNHESGIFSLKLWKNEILRDFQPDIIHAHTLGFDSRLGKWLKKLCRCPLAVTTHGGDTERPLARGQGEILRRDCAGLDRIVAVSTPLKNRLLTCGTDTPVTVIHNGFIPRTPEDEPRDGFGIIQVGHLVESKHFDTTLRALALLKSKYPALRLTVVGEGKLRGWLEGLTAELGLTDRVEFTGALSNAEVFRRMCRNRFFVMPSHPEGFGIVYLEAMAAGCVTFGTAGQGISDILESGKNGILLPPDDPEAIARELERLLEDPETADILAQNGRKLAKTVTWERCAREYLTLFESLR